MESSQGVFHQKKLRALSRCFKKLWPYIKHIVTLMFFALVIWLLIEHAQDVEWEEVRNALSDYSWQSILLGCLLALLTYLAYSSYDLFGRYFITSVVSKGMMMLVAFISCAFTLNIGAVIGSIGFRYRIYTQLNVTKGDVTRILGIGLTTNWLGYIMLAGVVFVSGAVVIPLGWAITTLFIRILGAAFIAAVVAYFVLCHFAKVRSWSIAGRDIVLPSVKLAVVQLLVSVSHWMLMASIMFNFLHTDVGYFELLGVLLISAIAGIIAHIPGALGVLEAVFFAFLSGDVAPSRLVAALIAYRAVFYLLPLSIALVSYLVIEAAVKKNLSPPTNR